MTLSSTSAHESRCDDLRRVALAAAAVTVVTAACDVQPSVEEEAVAEQAVTSSNVFSPPPMALPSSIYVDACSADPDEDRDRDMLKDGYENMLAEFFKPFFKLDSREPTTSLRPNEPATMFQVAPDDNDACIGAGCSQKTRIVIRFGFFWIRDGGFQIAGCTSTKHWGDNQGAAFTLESDDGGVTWAMKGWPVGSVEEAPYDPKGPLASLIPSKKDSHPVIYMSAGKHHHYDSVGTGSKKKHDYGFWGCDDATDGQHPASRYADLLSNFEDGRFNNIGEWAHRDKNPEIRT